MVNSFEISVNIIEELLITTFLMLYLGNKYNDFRKYVGFFLNAAIATITITFFNSLYINEGFLGFIFIVIYTAYALIFLKGDKYTKLFISGFINCLVYFIAAFSQIIINIILKTSIQDLYIMSNKRVILILLSKILFVAACIILLKLRVSYIGRQKNIALLIIMPIVTEISIIGIMQVFLENSELNFKLLLASASVMTSTFITYYVFIKSAADTEKEIQENALKQKEEYDKKYANEIGELYSKMAGIRHDLLLHFTTLNALLETGNEKAKEYISSVTHEQIQQVKHFIKTDNAYFDAIANAKLAVCENLGIKVRTRIMNNSLERLNHSEIASLFGNLFDNAIEASKDSRCKRIDLDVQLQRNHLSILIRNSIDRSVLHNNKYLMTTKNDKEYHGLGTKNIQRIVDKKKGIINYFEEDGYFVCDILI